MAHIRPFRALRPEPDAAAAVAAVPYDVVSRDEAKHLAEGNPTSFLHVSRSEINLHPDVSPYSEEVYQAAAKNFEQLKKSAPFVVEETESLYVYRLNSESHQQTGLAACYSLEEYERGVICKHERTRPDKEDDRTQHMAALRAQTGLVFLTYRTLPDITTLIEQICNGKPLLQITASDGVSHTIWRLNAEYQQQMVRAFEQVPVLYIADGHHRIASAARTREKLAVGGAGNICEADFVLGVAFPDLETRIQAYNRTLCDLNGKTALAFLHDVQKKFELQINGNPAPERGFVAMYLEGIWYSVKLLPVDGSKGVAGRLDVARLQDQLLEPLLNVTNVRTDPRIAFVGGARGTETLEEIVDSGQAAVAFSLYPVTTDELFAVSDAGDIMPPKSTWFEPKLRDGLLIHEI